MLGTELLARGNDEVIASITAKQVMDATSSTDERTGTEQVDSRFGRITVDYDKQIFMEKGLLGIPDKTQFCLLPFPVKKFPQFCLLHSLNDHALSLIVLPLALENELIATEDVLEAAHDLQIAPASLSMLLVVNVYREVNNVRMSVNARAPIFIDTVAKRGEQVVLRNTKYMVRTMLKGDLARPMGG
jgi:flagellar assembly factor FliW